MTEITDPRRRNQIVDAIQTGIEEGGTQAKCFIPRHGVIARAGRRTFEMAICFECHHLSIADEPAFRSLGDSALPALESALGH